MSLEIITNGRRKGGGMKSRYLELGSAVAALGIIIHARGELDSFIGSMELCTRGRRGCRILAKCYLSLSLYKHAQEQEKTLAPRKETEIFFFMSF